MDTTYDTARRCPKCGELGVETARKTKPDRSKLLTITCRNERCSWANTNFTISVRPDGTVPEPTLIRDKHYPRLPVDRTDEVRQSIDAQLNAEQSKGSELKRRY